MKYPEIGYGPWDDEPDRLEFDHMGLLCVLNRTKHGGNWCGYVCVDEDHPLFGVGYSEQSGHLADALAKREEMPLGKMSPFTLFLAITCEMGPAPTPEIVFDVHGGLTYSDNIPGGNWIVASERSGGSYFPGEVGWWFGFDCAHAGDRSPGHEASSAKYGLSPWQDGEYRTMDYAISETRRLAQQLVEMRPIQEQGHSLHEQGSEPCKETGQ